MKQRWQFMILSVVAITELLISYLNFSIFRSFNLEFLWTFDQIRILFKFQNRRNCHETIVSIGLKVKLWRNETGTNRIVWGGGEYLVEKLMKYFLLKCIDTWWGLYYDLKAKFLYKSLDAYTWDIHVCRSLNRLKLVNAVLIELNIFF